MKSSLNQRLSAWTTRTRKEKEFRNNQEFLAYQSTVDIKKNRFLGIQAVWRQGPLSPRHLRPDVWLQDFWCQRHLTPRHLTAVTSDTKTFDVRFGVSDIWRQTFVARHLNFQTFHAHLNFQTFVARPLTPLWIFRHLSPDIWRPLEFSDICRPDIWRPFQFSDICRPDIWRPFEFSDIITWSYINVNKRLFKSWNRKSRTITFAGSTR